MTARTLRQLGSRLAVLGTELHQFWSQNRAARIASRDSRVPVGVDRAGERNQRQSRRSVKKKMNQQRMIRPSDQRKALSSLPFLRLSPARSNLTTPLAPRAAGEPPLPLSRNGGAA